MTTKTNKAFYRILITLIFVFPVFAFANPAHEKISSLTESKRRLVFATFLENSGEKCPVVTKTYYQGSDKDGNAYWNASCQGADSYQIQVRNYSQGSTKILSCKVLKALNLSCFSKFKK